MKVTMSIQVIPTKGRVHEIVDKAIEVIDSSGMKYEVNAHSTIVEGDFKELMKLIEDLKEKIEKVCERFVLNVQFDVSRKGVTIDEKTKKYR